MTDPLKPDATLLIKLGSLLVHYEEFIETEEPLDMEAAQMLTDDPDVVEWRDQMNKLALLPLKR